MSKPNPNKKFLVRKINNDNEEFIESVTKSFIKSFRYEIPTILTPKKNLKMWKIKEQKFEMIKNILKNALIHEIEKENFKVVSRKSEKILKDYEQKIKHAKEDLDFINKKVRELADKEEEY